jgi:hypothetical protein
MYELKIIQHEDYGSPLEYDRMGTMAYNHRNYNLDEPIIGSPIDWLAGKLGKSTRGLSYDDTTLDNLQCDFFRKYVGFKLYLYDHSGLSLSTEPFSNRWDSGQIGYIYVSREDVRKEFRVSRVTKSIEAKAERILLAEVEQYDLYLRGEVYGFEITDESGEVVDSCYGFYGDDHNKSGLYDTIPNEYKHLIP